MSMKLLTRTPVSRCQEEPGNEKQGLTPAPVIRHVQVLAGAKDACTDLSRVVPAWIMSGFVHVFLMGLFLLVSVTGTGGSTLDRESAIETSLEEPNPRDWNLENDDIGNDSELLAGFSIDRVEDVAVPGPVVGERMGRLKAPDSSTLTVPPPPDFGGMATGRAVQTGAANIYGAPDAPGLQLVPG